jgi:hypothetical protein
MKFHSGGKGGCKNERMFFRVYIGLSNDAWLNLKKYFKTKIKQKQNENIKSIL